MLMFFYVIKHIITHKNKIIYKLFYAFVVHKNKIMYKLFYAFVALYKKT